MRLISLRSSRWGGWGIFENPPTHFLFLFCEKKENTSSKIELPLNKKVAGRQSRRPLQDIVKPQNKKWITAERRGRRSLQGTKNLTTKKYKKGCYFR